MLLRNEITSGYTIRSGLLRMMFIQEGIDHMLFGKRYHLKIMSATDFVEIEVNRDKTSNNLNSL